MFTNQVKRELQAGNVQIGTWITQIDAPSLPWILAEAGFDYVNIDMEHSCFSISSVANLCANALQAGLTPIVRPPANQPHLLSRPLDNGAMGIHLPHVDTSAAAEAAVAAMRFPPDGNRGQHTPTVTTGYTRGNAGRYMPHYNDQVLLIVQIESATAVANLDGILSVPGVNGAVVGRGDLAADLGVPGQLDHPKVLEAVDLVLDGCLQRGLFPNTAVLDVADAQHWIERGVLMLTYGNETQLLHEAGLAAVQGVGLSRSAS